MTRTTAPRSARWGCRAPRAGRRSPSSPTASSTWSSRSAAASTRANTSRSRCRTRQRAPAGSTEALLLHRKGHTEMTRTWKRTVLAATAIAGVTGLFAAAPRMTAQLSGQAPGFPTTKNGEWPYYTADVRGSRYSPLDQINGSNFNQLEVAWRFKTDNLGTRPEFKLEGTPLMVKGIVYATGGSRRSVVPLDAKTGELIWVHAEMEGARAVNAPRQLY